MNNKPSLAGLSPEDILSMTGIKERYRGRQIFEWLKRGAESFEQMTNLPAALREKLADSFCIFSTTVETAEVDDDGTAKIALRMHDDCLIEAVLLIDENERRTACLSSQVGCAMGCSFCRTGMMGFRRNLSSVEIIEQFMHLQSLYGEISNIVYMGMGEPLMNTGEVIKSLEYFTSEKGLGMSARRITVSTCGITEGIKRLADEAPPVRLAVSLVSADPETRTEIMPVTRTSSLDSLKTALMHYQQTGGRRITLECAIIGGVNDRREGASLIAAWSEGLSVNVNVIPWNPASEIDFREPTMKNLEAFCRELERKKIPYTRRYRRGRGLNAACGQLAVNLDKNKS
ncbi:MAG: 23S rRNA (adenine(2503)-C(2))-methyltransferase RlmN [Spirochaetales bacterium]|uniref:23S rRNA (Adenine(2503)-C(2))-methyltransferase RlmN n=1 Tax=Candidatus Thalassospirochaeta sargassi TaxID=3119039 RepID=A0AAJ1IJM2_9SPIO|nr:23S rRNA (adenine(2503)-C(2))-methyltransferase RlmN [Spirochaetales bacterium]